MAGHNIEESPDNIRDDAISNGRKDTHDAQDDDFSLVLADVFPEDFEASRQVLSIEFFYCVGWGHGVYLMSERGVLQIRNLNSNKNRNL